MARTPKVLKPEESYTFSRYFELPFDIEDILADLGCSMDRIELPLPRYEKSLEGLEQVQAQLQDGIRYVGVKVSSGKAGGFSMWEPLKAD